MNITKLVQQLKRHEGLRLSPYKDSEGFLTIGYGHNLHTSDITLKQAEIWLNEDIAAVSIDLFNSKPFIRELIEIRQRVLINMAFNLGLNGLLKFKKMWGAIEIHNFHLASTEMLDSKWADQVGSRAIELADMMQIGIDYTDRK